MLAQTRQQGFLQAPTNRLAVGLGLLRPIGPTLQMGHRGEHIKSVTATWCHRGVGGARAMQVEAEIVGQAVVPKNIGEQAFVARAQHHGVVGNIGVLPVGTKVPNEQTHGVAATLYALVGPVPPVLGGHQVAVSPCGVAVADHDVGAQLLASGELHTGGSTVFNHDALDLGIAAQGHAACLQQIDHALHDGSGAAHGRVNPVAPLQGVDQAVNARHRERIAANQQGLQAHGHA